MVATSGPCPDRQAKATFALRYGTPTANNKPPRLMADSSREQDHAVGGRRDIGQWIAEQVDHLAEHLACLDFSR